MVMWLGTANELQPNGANPGTTTAGIYNCHGNETGEMCFYYVLTYHVEATLHGQNLYLDNTGQFMTGSFIVLVPK